VQDDFVKVRAKYSDSGISAEYGWIKYAYPEYFRVKQSLMDIKTNGRVLPCDLFLLKNNNTEEIKSVYFEISDFLEIGIRCNNKI
jgi:hypothetical protein